MKIYVFDRKTASEFYSNQKYIHIDIGESDDVFLTPKDCDNRIGYLRIKFNDIDKFDHKNPEFILFNSNHANQILDFIEKYNNMINLIVINCSMGVSRSAGVGVALDYIFNKATTIAEKKHAFNRHVNRVLVETYFERNDI